MNIKNFLNNFLILFAILGCEAKTKNGDSEEKKFKNSTLTTPQKAIFNCKLDDNCSSFFDYLADMAFCNKTTSTCINYCYVKIPCTNDIDCSYSIGDPKKCGVECYKSNVNDTIGKCLIVSKQGQYCNNNHIICEDDLICDFYTDTCITKAEAQNQSGEPLFSLFLFMLIMLSLFNRQRADEDILNNVAPNELLMVTLPNRRHRPEDDELPVYQPLDAEGNDDEILEQNLEVPPSNNNENTSIEPTESNNEIGMVVDDDDLPLLPPTYDEAVSGFIADSDQQPLVGSTEQDVQHPLQSNNNDNTNPSS